MTDEHVWGDWIKAHVARQSNKHDYAGIHVPTPGNDVRAPVRIRAGDPLNSQVRVVYSTCNSGWLSGIQNAAKPYLLPLFNGTSMTLDLIAQNTIATWIAMATMTGEYIARDENKVAISQAQRNWLKEKKMPPIGWRIWIGKYRRRTWRGQWVHVSFPVLDTDTLPAVVDPHDRKPNSQTTTFVVGQLYVFAMSTPFPEIAKLWDWRTAPRAHECLQQIWPLPGRQVPWPASEMSDTDAESIATAYKRYSDDLAHRVGYR